MRFVFNVIWFVLAGLWLAIAYCLAGIIMCILIITIPFGIQAFKLAGFALWPFGRTMIKREDAGGASTFGNVIWLILVGWWLALSHLVTAAAQVITIIGIPLAVANVKMIPGSLWPFGREIVRIGDLSEDARRQGDALVVPGSRT